MMMTEKSLLQQIREKELMINIRIDEARREAEAAIISARLDASKMNENSEREGERSAREFYEKEMEKIREVNKQLKNQGEQQAISVRENGERNVPAAIEKIVRAVLME
jgi:V/A-type H+/Na+-transporting ATPase subunit G/H